MPALCTQTYIPVRAEATDRSEMVSQLLFGETCQITREEGKWVRVRCDFDEYEGWVYRPSLYVLTDQQYEYLMHLSRSVVNVPILPVRDDKDQQIRYLTVGSTMYNLDTATGKFSLLDRNYTCAGNVPVFSSVSVEERIIGMAKQLVYVPYLWGGRSTFGIDCSGLIQTCFKVGGIALPRDASQQAQKGISVDSFADIRPADLAFFQNAEGRIVHVGLLISPSLIIHASNFVQISTFDEYGILHADRQTYTHHLAFIKRLI